MGKDRKLCVFDLQKIATTIDNPQTCQCQQKKTPPTPECRRTPECWNMTPIGHQIRALRARLLECFTNELTIPEFLYEDFRVVVPMPEISSARIFYPDIYKRFQESTLNEDPESGHYRVARRDHAQEAEEQADGAPESDPQSSDFTTAGCEGMGHRDVQADIPITSEPLSGSGLGAGREAAEVDRVQSEAWEGETVESDPVIGTGCTTELCMNVWTRTVHQNGALWPESGMIVGKIDICSTKKSAQNHNGIPADAIVLHNED